MSERFTVKSNSGRWFSDANGRRYPTRQAAVNAIRDYQYQANAGRRHYIITDLDGKVLFDSHKTMTIISIKPRAA